MAGDEQRNETKRQATHKENDRTHSGARKIFSLTTTSSSGSTTTTVLQQLTKIKTGVYIIIKPSNSPMSQSLPGVSPFPFAYPDADKNTLLPPAFQLFHAGPTAPPLFSRRLHSSKTLAYSYIRNAFCGHMPEAVNTCPIPKRISEATNKNVPGSYLKNKGDIGRTCRAA